MSEFTQNKTASFFVTLLIGIIILSFMFTGYQTLQQGSPNAIGKVGDQIIKPEEYQQEYNRQIEFFKQMMGGEISAKQVEQMGIKQSILKNLIQRKLMIKFATDMGSFPSQEQVVTEVKSLPYFQSNGQFDLEKYKAVLQANRLTPQEFEEDVINQLKLKSTQDLVRTFPLSNGYLKDLDQIRQEKLSAEVVKFSKNSLRNFITVSKDDVNKFIAVETNALRLKSMFNERKSSLDKAEEVKARHILLLTQGKDEAKVKAEIEKIAKTVTPANFAKMADKYTEDPSGKGKGGDLGSFGKGRMVPEFDNVAFTIAPKTVSAPVKTQFGYHLIMVEQKSPAKVATFEEYKEKFATELIQKDKVEDIKKLTTELTANLQKALESGSEKELKALTEKYKAQSIKTTANRLDGISGDVNLSADSMSKLFSGDLSKSKVNVFDEDGNIVIVKTVLAPASATDATKLASNDSASLKNALSRKMMDSILKKLEEDTRVKINSNMIQE